MQRHFVPSLRPSSRGTIIAAVLAASVLASTASASDTAPAQPGAAMRQALQRDLGLSGARLDRYLRTERQALRAQADARRALGDRFGGAWLERDATGDYRLVVGSTAAATDPRVRALGGDVRRVAHSLASLESAVGRLDRARGLAAASPRIHGWRIDLPNNRVVLTTDPGATSVARAFAATHGLDPAMVRVETALQRPQPVYDIRGGDRYNTPSSWCSIGFSVTRGGDTGFATAGHCAAAGTAVTGFNGVALGSFAGSTFPGSDIAWVRNTNPGSWSIQPLVNNYAGGNIGVYGGIEAPVGAAICRSGARTGYRCGTVTAKNVTVNYSVGPVYGMVRSSACVGGGDSGGSFVTPGGEAQGVTSGGVLNPNTNENCSIASPVTYHQPLQPLLNAYGLTLQAIQSCGRMNPGRVLATGASATSCDGRFTFVIQSDGNLVLYQAGVGAIWANHVYGNGHILAMQTDGNLVVYNSAGQARWSTGTHGRNGATLFVQNDGNVVVYSHLGQALWSTGTCCR
jgi:hypothetical protein